MDIEGAKRVEVVGKEDKLTAVLGGSLVADFLPSQLIYEGKTALPSKFQVPREMAYIF